MKILVPLDGSEIAETALPIALRLAQHSGDSIVLVSAVSRRREPPPRAEPDVASVSDAQAYLDAAKSHLCPSHVCVETAVWLGLPAAAIVRAAAAVRADVIVMTTHGRTGRHGESMGAIAEGVLDNAAAEVIVVRPRRRDVTAATAASAG